MTKLVFTFYFLVSLSAFGGEVVIGEGEARRGGYNSCTTLNIQNTIEVAREEAVFDAEEKCQSDVEKIRTIEEHWSCPLGASVYARVVKKFHCID